MSSPQLITDNGLIQITGPLWGQNKTLTGILNQEPNSETSELGFHGTVA